MGSPEQDWECTCFFDGWWKRCCVAHDISCADSNAPKAIKSGEWVQIREAGDKALRECVQRSGPKWIRPISRFIGNIMYEGVSRYTEWLKTTR